MDASESKNSRSTPNRKKAVVVETGEVAAQRDQKKTNQGEPRWLAAANTRRELREKRATTWKMESQQPSHFRQRQVSARRERHKDGGL